MTLEQQEAIIEAVQDQIWMHGPDVYLKDKFDFVDSYIYGAGKEAFEARGIDPEFSYCAGEIKYIVGRVDDWIEERYA